MLEPTQPMKQQHDKIRDQQSATKFYHQQLVFYCVTVASLALQIWKLRSSNLYMKNAAKLIDINCPARPGKVGS